MEKSKNLGFKDVLNESSMNLELCRTVFERHSVAPPNDKDGNSPKKVILHSTWLELCMLAGINLPAHVIEAVGVKNKEATDAGLSFEQFLSALTEACNITGRISVKQALNATSGGSGNLPSPRAPRLPAAFKPKTNAGWSSPRGNETPNTSSANSTSSFELPKIHQEGPESRVVSRARLGAPSNVFVKEKDENALVFEKIVGRLESLLQARHQQDENAAGSRALLDLIKSMAQRVDTLEASDKAAKAQELSRAIDVDSRLAELFTGQDASKTSLEKCNVRLSSLDTQLLNNEKDWKILLEQKIAEVLVALKQQKAEAEADHESTSLAIEELKNKVQDLEIKYAEMEDQSQSTKEEQATMIADQASLISNMEMHIDSLVSVFQTFQSSSTAAMQSKDKEIAGLKSSLETTTSMLLSLREEYTRMIAEASASVAEKNEALWHANEETEEKARKMQLTIEELEARLSSTVSLATSVNAGVESLKAESEPLSQRISSLEMRVESLSEAKTASDSPQSQHSKPVVDLDALESSVRQLQDELSKQKQAVRDLMEKPSTSLIPPGASPAESSPGKESAASSREFSDLKSQLSEEVKAVSKKAAAVEESVVSKLKVLSAQMLEFEKKLQGVLSQRESNADAAASSAESISDANERITVLEEQLAFVLSAPPSIVPPTSTEPAPSSTGDAAGKLAAFEHKIASTLQQMHQLSTQKLTELSGRLAEVEKVTRSLSVRQQTYLGDSSRPSPTKL